MEAQLSSGARAESGGMAAEQRQAPVAPSMAEKVKFAKRQAGVQRSRVWGVRRPPARWVRWGRDATLKHPRKAP